MNNPRRYIISIGIFGILLSCRQTTKPDGNQAGFVHDKHYVSIDGLWRVTPETALKFPNGTLEPIILFQTNSQGKLTAQGCFLWDNRFYDYWPLKNIQFNDSTDSLVIDYNETGTYKGILDYQKESIQGIACGGDPSDTNKLDFIREEILDINKLFVPYPRDQSGSISYVYQKPEYFEDQLQTASLFDYTADSTSFYNLLVEIINQKYGRLESLIIIKEGKLIVEEYFYGYDRTQLHHIHSCTKSVTSLLLGIALDRHNKLNVDQSIFDFFPLYDSPITPEKEQITLKQVLTMTAGISEEGDFDVDNPFDQSKQILDQPLESAPGEKFTYNNNSTTLLGSIIYALENEQADEFASKVLFNKLGISEFVWERENGLVHCYSDLYLKPRDMAKIGLLVLQNGLWNGQQIVPKEWITESTKPHSEESEFFDYGYQWWHRSKQNTSWWENPVRGSNNEHDMFLALGYGGQYIMVIRDLNMVIVTTSSDYNEENGMAHQKVPMVIEDIVPLFD